MPVALMAQLAAAKPSDVWVVGSNFGAVTWSEIFLTQCPTMSSDDVVGTRKFDIKIDEGRGLLNTSREKRI